MGNAVGKLKIIFFTMKGKHTILITRADDERFLLKNATY